MKPDLRDEYEICCSFDDEQDFQGPHSRRSTNWHSAYKLKAMLRKYLDKDVPELRAILFERNYYEEVEGLAGDDK